MIVKVRKIGNSVGVLLSKAILDQCSIKDEVSLEVKGNTIVIHPVTTKPRQGWKEQFLQAGSLEDKELLMGEFDNSFDQEEWTW
jgi:antitoxin MazE